MMIKVIVVVMVMVVMLMVVMLVVMFSRGVAMQVQIPAGMYPGSTFAVASPAAPALGVVEGVSYAEEEAGEPVLQAKVVPEREW